MGCHSLDGHGAVQLRLQWFLEITVNPRFFVLQLLALGCCVQAQIIRQPNTTLRLPKDIPGSTYTVEDAFGEQSHFSMPVCITSPPGDKDRFVVLEKGGRAFLVTRSGGTFSRSLFLDMHALLAARHEGALAANSEWGLLGIAFHPDFARNGFFYVAYDLSIDEGGRRKTFNRLARFSVLKSDPNRADVGSEVPMISQLDLANNHNGGDLHFGPDGYLLLFHGG